MAMAMQSDQVTDSSIVSQRRGNDINPFKGSRKLSKHWTHNLGTIFIDFGCERNQQKQHGEKIQS